MAKVWGWGTRAYLACRMVKNYSKVFTERHLLLITKLIAGGVNSLVMAACVK